MKSAGKEMILRVFLPKSSREDQELWFKTTDWAQSLAKTLDVQNQSIDGVIKVAELYQKEYHKVSRLYLDLTVCPWWNFRKRDRIHSELIDLILLEEKHNQLIIEFEKLKKLTNNGTCIQTEPGQPQ
jgi:hypothetical protein